MNGGNKCVFSHHDSKSAGVCVMFKKGLDFVIHNSEIDRNGHYIILDITIHTQRLTFVCLYGYNTDEPSLFNIILQKLLTFSTVCFLKTHNGCMFTCGPIKYICLLF
jgi:hypothetical protein